MVQDGFELFSLEWFWSVAQEVFKTLMIGSCLMLCGVLCAIFKNGGCSCIECMTNLCSDTPVRKRALGMWCFLSVVVGGMVFFIGYGSCSQDSADSQPGVWMSTQCRVLGTGLQASYLGKGGSNSHMGLHDMLYVAECDPTNPTKNTAAFSGYTSFACEQLEQMKHHEEWAEPSFSCDTDSFPGCAYVAWARVNVAGLGERCAYELGHTGIDYTGSWHDNCEAQKRLLQNMKEEAYLGRETVKCWVNSKDNSVLSFESDLFFYLKQRFFNDSVMTAVGAVYLMSAAVAALIILFSSGTAVAARDFGKDHENTTGMSLLRAE